MAPSRKPAKKANRTTAAPTEKTIERRVGLRSFERGQEYFKSGMIFDARLQGGLIKARCHGQSAGSYWVSARVDGGLILEAACSCPVGGGGCCKHVAALLLTWRHSPEEFRETQPVGQRLAECEKSELIELIEAMLDREPELESWIEAALPASARDGAAVSIETYRDQTIAAFGNADYSWEGEDDLMTALESLRGIGDRFRERDDYESALIVYSGILDGFTGKYESDQDENGDLGGEAGECIEALGECLSHLDENSEARPPALSALFDVLRLDLEIGGVGLSDDVPDILLKRTTADECQAIAGWIREETSDDGDGFIDSWRRKAWGGLLLDFEEEPTDDEAYLRHCREFGLTDAVVERLLERGRLDEALQEINASSDYELMGHADRLIAHKHVDLAHTLIRDRLSSDNGGRNNRQLREWLGRFYESRKDWQSLLDLRVDGFDSHLTLAAYEEIRKCAKKLKVWDSLRPEIISRVPEDSPERIRIHLDEGEISEAIELFNAGRGKKPGFHFGWNRVDQEVAKAAEKSHPEAALEIYRREAERLIAARNRKSYQSACDYLKKVSTLFKTMNRAVEWKTYFSQLQEKNRTLRALREELRKAGLS